MKRRKLKMFKTTKEEYDCMMALTKCWSCGKYCSGCTWSDRTFRPIEGWRATERVVDHSKHKNGIVYTTYFVHECPEYECDIYYDEKTRTKPIVGSPLFQRNNPSSKPVYLLEGDGKFHLYASINDASKRVAEIDATIKSYTAMNHALRRMYKVTDKEYFFCKGHYFKKYERSKERETD